MGCLDPLSQGVLPLIGPVRFLTPPNLCPGQVIECP
jgi:hypothetical protein